MAHLLRSIIQTLDTYEVLMSHLADISHDDAKAEGVYNILASTETVALMMVLRVIKFCLFFTFLQN